MATRSRTRRPSPKKSRAAKKSLEKKLKGIKRLVDANFPKRKCPKPKPEKAVKAAKPRAAASNAAKAAKKAAKKASTKAKRAVKDAQKAVRAAVKATKRARRPRHVDRMVRPVAFDPYLAFG